ncbi:MAG: hypothetical protein RBU37_02555 [Myxococcota bacterium]|jgi:UDP-N-acetylglucosamine/UDP-N-acetylgalactosamine diphosphorylase|nr:hypothetical protein [Myxococcota bacterium]
MTTKLIDSLQRKGVIVHCPEACVIEDVAPERIAAGVELFPGTCLRGQRTLLMAGAKLGKAGGGYFENVVAGRDVELYGGVFHNCVLRHGVVVRGHAELRQGTLMEEGGDLGHHVGFKMTVTLPFVVAGSLINFCDALVAGGSSRRDHSEIGSSLALYNFTPWGDKFASLFGDVPHGVLLRSPRIFIGGQCQIVSPVSVGYGALIPAGCSVRRNVPAGRMYGETSPSFDQDFDLELLGALRPKLDVTCAFIGNLWALRVWTEKVRLPLCTTPLEEAFEREALAQLDAGIAERIKRLSAFHGRMPRSLEKHRASAASASREKRIREHEQVLAQWPALQKRLSSAPSPKSLDAVRDAMRAKLGDGSAKTYIDALRSLNDALAAQVVETLQDVVCQYACAT